MGKVAIVLVLTLVLLLLCFVGLGIRTLLHRGELKRHCSGIDPYSGKHNGCSCADWMGESCAERNRRPYQPMEVNENIYGEL